MTINLLTYFSSMVEKCNTIYYSINNFTDYYKFFFFFVDVDKINFTIISM